MPRFIRCMGIGLLIGMWASISNADENAIRKVAREQLRALDGQVQEFKDDILNFSSELIQLEEKMLFPSGTQLSVFIVLTEGDQYSFGAVKIKIDGKETANHIYTRGELDALQRGGAHRIFTGGIPAGEHVLDVELIGTPSSKYGERQEAQFKFTKDAVAKVIEIIFAEPGFGRRISFRD